MLNCIPLRIQHSAFSINSMISLTCTKCKATLEMDDAFAGGVCRCQYCGTIQTVPSRLKGSGRPGSPASITQKALYAGSGNTGGGAMPSSGLDDLATAVASSGISSNLSSQASSSATSSSKASAPKAKPANKMPLYLALGGCGVLAIVVVILLISRSGGDKPTPGPDTSTPQRSTTGGKTPGGQTPPNTAAQLNTPSGPHFGPLAISGSKVVYVIDRGSANVSVFDPLKSVIVDSVVSLGPAAKFQVLFWTPGGPKDNPNEYAYPKGKLVAATSTEADKLRKELEDISTGTATDVSAALKEAVSKRDADVIIIATAKGFLDDSFAANVKKIRGNKKMPIHTVDLTESGDGRAVLEKIANDTGGTYINIKPSALK